MKNFFSTNKIVSQTWLRHSNKKIAKAGTPALSRFCLYGLEDYVVHMYINADIITWLVHPTQAQMPFTKMVVWGKEEDLIYPIPFGIAALFIIIHILFALYPVRYFLD